MVKTIKDIKLDGRLGAGKIDFRQFAKEEKLKRKNFVHLDKQWDRYEFPDIPQIFFCRYGITKDDETNRVVDYFAVIVKTPVFLMDTSNTKKNSDIKNGMIEGFIHARISDMKKDYKRWGHHMAVFDQNPPHWMLNKELKVYYKSVPNYLL